MPEIVKGDRLSFLKIQVFTKYQQIESTTLYFLSQCFTKRKKLER